MSMTNTDFHILLASLWMMTAVIVFENTFLFYICMLVGIFWVVMGWLLALPLDRKIMRCDMLKVQLISKQLEVIQLTIAANKILSLKDAVFGKRGKKK